MIKYTGFSEPILRNIDRGVVCIVLHMLPTPINATCPFQRLHDHAIEKRTQLKVKMEAEQQQQDLTDSKLLNEQQRSVLREWLGSVWIALWGIRLK